MHLDTISQALYASWSRKSCSRHDPAAPATGQCSVTAIVIHELFGGQILKTRVAGSYHFYNRIHGELCDFTMDQFAGAIPYLNLPSSVTEALTDCTEEQVAALRAEVIRYLAGRT